MGKPFEPRTKRDYELATKTANRIVSYPGKPGVNLALCYLSAQEENKQLKTIIAELCEEVEQIGPWGEDSNSARVCDICGGGDEKAVDKPLLAHYESCIYYTARKLIE